MLTALEQKPGSCLRRGGRGLVWFLAALILPIALAMAEETADEVLDARLQGLSDIERQIQTLSDALAGQQTDRRVLIDELETQEREIATLDLTGRKLDSQVREQTRIAGELRTRQAEERQALSQEIAALSDLVRTAYVMGRADRLRLLLNQEDPIRASRVMSYFAYFNRERLRRIAAVQARAKHIQTLARETEREVVRLTELAAQQEAARVRLEGIRQERTAVLARLESTIASSTQDLQGLQQDAQSLRLLVEHLRQRAQIRAELEIHREPFGALKGRLGWPLLEGRILAGFGTPKEESELTWDGVLLEARTGEKVRAVHDGQVVYADWLRGFGLLLVIDHGDGFMTLYGHNRSLLKESGEWVATGDVIALTGDGGGRVRPVLYFAIRQDGRPQDPTAWCGGGGPAEPPRHSG